MSAELVMPATPIDRSTEAEEVPDTGVRPHRWTRIELYRALEYGVFPPTMRMELIEGEVIEKMTQNPPHAKALSKSAKVLKTAFGEDCHVLQQSPLSIGEEIEPEPDIMVVAGAPDDYEEHPTRSGCEGELSPSIFPASDIYSLLTYRLISTWWMFVA